MLGSSMENLLDLKGNTWLKVKLHRESVIKRRSVVVYAFGIFSPRIYLEKTIVELNDPSFYRRQYKMISPILNYIFLF